MTELAIKLAEHPIFETERLILRKVEISDAEDIYAYSSDPEVARFVTFTPHENLQRTKEGIVSYFYPKRLSAWGIVDKSSGHLIGTIDLRVKGDSGAFGWVLSRDFWGQGLMPEAAACLVDFAFQELGLKVLTADHFVENKRSSRVMEKIGMRRIGQIYLYVTKLEKSVLCDCWALTKEDYDAAKN